MQVVKERLAKLLSTENIHVRHSAKARTASFDVNRRILTLPVWKQMDEDLYDMLTGHEVGHALFTPNQGWQDAIKVEGVNKNILNIVEDPRIEKKIKIRYPGLNKAFTYGYRTLLERDFFGPIHDFDKMNVLDRLNMHFKVGASYGVPFAQEEVWMVKLIDSVDTWEDCVEASKILQMYFSDTIDLTEGHFDLPSFGMDDGETGESENGEESSDLEQAINDMLSELEEGSADEDGEETGEENTQTVNGGYDSKDFDKDAHEVEDEDIETVDEYEKRKEDLTEMAEGQGPEYFTLPNVNLKKVIIPFKRVHKELGTVFNLAEENGTTTLERKAIVLKDYNKFRLQSNKIINYMVKEFERKKAADEYKRTAIAKTGIINVNKLHQYKYSDDLFLKRSIVHDGKNHGLVMLVDWSGSMYSNLKPTFRQLANLVWFCNKVNIPFEVYAFTNSYRAYKPAVDGLIEPMEMTEPEIENSFGPYKDGDAYFDYSHFKLLNLLSSRMSAPDLQKAMHHLWRIADHSTGYGERINMKGYDMGSTPLVEGLVAMQQIIPNFKAHYKLDKVNFICLTDGEGNTYFGSTYDAFSVDGNVRKSFRYRSKLVYEDPLTRKTYTVGETAGKNWRYSRAADQQASFLVGLLKDRFGINSIGIYLDGWSKTVSRGTLEKYLGWFNYNKEAHQKVRKQARKDGFCTVTNAGWDEYYIMPVATMSISDQTGLPHEDGSLHDMKVGKLKSIFAKSQKQKFGNRIMVNRIMDLIS